MMTETLDKAYLEYAQLTQARNFRELKAAKILNLLIASFALLEESTLKNGLINTANEVLAALK